MPFSPCSFLLDVLDMMGVKILTFYILYMMFMLFHTPLLILPNFHFFPMFCLVWIVEGDYRRWKNGFVNMKV